MRYIRPITGTVLGLHVQNYNETDFEPQICEKPNFDTYTSLVKIQREII